MHRPVPRYQVLTPFPYVTGNGQHYVDECAGNGERDRLSTILNKYALPLLSELIYDFAEKRRMESRQT